jgi:glycyl-tRNA synthetase
MSDLMEMLKRRGFLWSSFEIYGGSAGFFDYGPLGAMMKRNLEELWRYYFVIKEGMYEIDSPTIGLEDVFVASGHVKEFVDVLIECSKCGAVYRADHYIEERAKISVDPVPEEIQKALNEHAVTCECGGTFSHPVEFNLMFKTAIGPGSRKTGYLRPETAQGMFVNFPRLLKFFRNKLPFGVVQIGRAYRNEISPRQGVIRLREFNQAEAEVFVHPAEKKHPGFDSIRDEKLLLVTKFDEEITLTAGEAVEKGIIAHEMLGYFIVLTKQFLVNAGVDEERLRFRQHRDDERAHYATDCWDAEAKTSYGWIEIVGIADRTDYDLKKHMEHSQKDLTIFIQYEKPMKVRRKKIIPKMNIIGPQFKDKVREIVKALENYEFNGKVSINIGGEKITLSEDMYEIKEVEEEITGERIIPHVIEPSFGIDRIFYTILEHSFDEDEVDGEKRNVLHLPGYVAPIQVGVLPLLSKKELMDVAKDINTNLRINGILAEIDESGSIGRRYRRFDEIGTPFCVTVDYDTLRNNTVTIRERDTTRQIRVPVDDLVVDLKELLSLKPEKAFEELGEIVR